MFQNINVSTRPVPIRSRSKVQMVKDCFVWDCFLGSFYVSDCFVWDCFVWDYFVHALSRMPRHKSNTSTRDDEFGSSIFYGLTVGNCNCSRNCRSPVKK